MGFNLNGKDRRVSSEQAELAVIYGQIMHLSIAGGLEIVWPTYYKPDYRLVQLYRSYLHFMETYAEKIGILLYPSYSAVSRESAIN